MDFAEYQQRSRATAIYPDAGFNLGYPAMGLGSEAGEVLNVVKKVYRDRRGLVTEEVRQKIKKELGDVLWYVAQVATEAKLDLGEVALENLEKLSSRQKRGTLRGDGDDR